MSKKWVFSSTYLDQGIRGNLVNIVPLENSICIISIIDVNSSYLVCQINSCIQMTSNHMLMIILTDDVKSAHLYKVDFFSDKNFKICVYFFSCILPDYMADDIIKDF